MNEDNDNEKKVIVASPIDSAKVFAKPGVTVISELDSKAKLKTPIISKPYYYLAIPKWNFQEAFPECQEVYKVVRQSVPLTIVKRCD